jgi:hypothetical protein
MRLALGTLTTFIALSIFMSSPAAQLRAPTWSEPVNLGAPINGPFQDNRAALSRDGLSLYFGSTRPCGIGDTVLDANLWVGRRGSPSAPWQVECLRINVDGYFDNAPDLSLDGRWLYFVSDRPGSTGIQRDIWVSRRRDVHDDQGWSEPVNLGPPVNTNAPEIASSYFTMREARYLRMLAKQKLMFGRPTSGDFDIWEVNMLDDLPFGSAKRVEELSTTEFWESGASVSPDGLELFFHRSVPNGPFDIYVSTRREPDLPWSAPVEVGPPVSMPSSSDSAPTRSPDGKVLFFESNRPGGLGNLDIWMSTREGDR